MGGWRAKGFLVERGRLAHPLRDLLDMAGGIGFTGRRRARVKYGGAEGASRPGLARLVVDENDVIQLLHEGKPFRAHAMDVADIDAAVAAHQKPFSRSPHLSQRVASRSVHRIARTLAGLRSLRELGPMNRSLRTRSLPQAVAFLSCDHAHKERQIAA